VLNKLSQVSDKLVDVSLGRLPADLLLKNCNLLNTYSGEIMENVEIAIYNDRIAFVGSDASHIKSNKIIDLEKMYVSPGLMDAHTHLDFLISPTEFAKRSLLHGTLTLFADPVDMVSVLGYKGFNLFLKEVRTLPIKVFTMVPMALPQDPKFSNAHYMKYQEVVKALEDDDVLGLGEVLSWTRVIDKEKQLLKIMKYALSRGKIINGHTAGARGSKLASYISSGIFSCHEPINYDEAVERLRLGMWVMLREGSVRRDLEAIASQLRKNEISYSRIMVASDGVDPEDMMNIGYIDHCMRLLVKSGMHPARAAQIASLNIATYYGLDEYLGGVAPGKVADMVVFKNLEDFAISKVFVNGKLIIENGSLIVKQKAFRYPAWIKNTIRVKKRLAAQDFRVRVPREKVHDNKIRVIVANLQTSIITKQETMELPIEDNSVMASRENDVWKVAVIDRHHKSGNIGIGFMKGFKTDIDAFACTINVDENQLVIMGMDEEDMTVASNAIIDMRGGFAAVKNQQVIARYAMDIAGIMSSKRYEEASREYMEMNSILKKYGCPFDKPMQILFFVTFVALPEIRFTDKGMVNVKKREYASIFA
jgi:adenine deaminase